MKPVYVCGMGAVSPAGWGVPALRAALWQDEPLPAQPLPRPGRAEPLKVRPVPSPTARPAFFAHPRLRRASAITQHAAAAAMEAAATLLQNGSTSRRVGLIACFQSGCVQYSCRFYEEMLQDPATASPLVFPETVFAAPGSHIAALIGNAELVCSLVGDPGCYLQGVALAAAWLLEERVDVCLVLGAEENHWLNADALWHFDHSAVYSSGAGALCLSTQKLIASDVCLEAVTDAHTLSAKTDRPRAASAMRKQLPAGATSELLCDSLSGRARADAAELAAWSDWPGIRRSPKRILGDGFMATAAWQCVAACDAVATGEASAAMVSLAGGNQQVIGARFSRLHA